MTSRCMEDELGQASGRPQRQSELGQDDACLLLAGTESSFPSKGHIHLIHVPYQFTTITKMRITYKTHPRSFK